MKKITFFKTLLVAAGLLGGSNAWADTFSFNEKDYTIVYSDDFTDAENYAKYASIGNTGRCEAVQYTRTDITGDDVKALVMYEYTNQNASDCYYNLFTSSETGISTYKTVDDYAITFDWSLAYGYNQQSSFIIKNASGSQLIKFVAGKTSTEGYIYLNGSETADETTFNPNPSYGYNNHVVPTFTQFYTITIWANATDGTKLKMVNQKDATDTHTFTLSDDIVYLGQMQFGSGRYYAGVCIDNIKVGIYSEEEIVPNPSAAITSVNGSNRTLTMTLGTGSSDGTVIKYYTDTEEKSDLATYSAPFIVSSTSTIYYYAESTSGAVSDEQSISVTCEALTLNTPSISRSGNNVTISDDQSNLDGAPTSTIYYTYGGDPIEYTGAITVAADATISAYATATGYTTSETVTRAVALFPSAGITQTINAPENNTYTTGNLNGENVIGTNATFQALIIDGEQWGGENVFVQSTDFGFRNGGSGKDWYIDNTLDTWVLIKGMKAGDIIVANTSYQASSLTNATYTEKYSIGNSRAYTVTADGDVELAFKKPNTKTMHYFYGIYAYTHNVTGTQIGAFDNTTDYLAATSDKVTLTPGSSYRYQFKNYNTGGNGNWNNFVLAAYDSSDNLKVAVRADNFEVVDWKDTGCSNDFDWSNFVSEMNGATVDMIVSYSESNVFSMSSTITTAGSSTWTYSYTSDYTGSGISLSDDIQVALSVDYSWLDLISASEAILMTSSANLQGYKTFYNATKNFEVDENTTIYKAAAPSNGYVTITAVEGSIIPADTPVFLKTTDTESYAITLTETDEEGTGDFTGNALQAAEEDGEIDGAYILAYTTDGGLGIYQYTSSLDAGDVYLTAANQDAKLRFGFADDATAIKTIAVDAADNAAIYNLSGQRVNAAYKGIVINNGKKYLNK